MIAFNCPCGQHLEVADASAGNSAKCPKCDQVVRVPPLQPASASPSLLFAVGRGSLALLFLSGLAAIYLLWQSPHGILRVECDDPDVEIVVDNVGPAIKGVDKNPIKLKTGLHRVIVKRGNLSFETDQFLTEKNQTCTLKSELFPDKMHLMHQHGRVLGAKAIPLAATFTNSIGMEFVLVPKGKVSIGGGGGKVGHWDKEIALDFYLGKHEVTQEEWVKLMKTNPSAFSRTGKDRHMVADIDEKELKRFPVEMVSWDDCQEYLTLLNEMEKVKGWKYRLPTALEWEYACRGGPTNNATDHGFDYYFERPTDVIVPKDANFDHDHRIGLDCTTCTATSGSGATMWKEISPRRGWAGAAAGTTPRDTAGRR